MLCSTATALREFRAGTHRNLSGGLRRHLRNPTPAATCLPGCTEGKSRGTPAPFTAFSASEIAGASRLSFFSYDWLLG